MNSVIIKLSADSEHHRSSALAHAYSLRARARADQQKWALSLEDTNRVVLDKDLRRAATESCLSTAYRVWVDAEKQLSTGSEKVVAVLQQWQNAQPSFRTKLQREINELLEKNGK